MCAESNLRTVVANYKEFCRQELVFRGKAKEARETLLSLLESAVSPLVREIFPSFLGRVPHFLYMIFCLDREMEIPFNVESDQSLAAAEDLKQAWAGAIKVEIDKKNKRLRFSLD